MKEALQHLFNNDFPGSEVFLEQVIRPVICDDITFVQAELLDENTIYRERAKLARIQSIRYVADIENLESDKISFFDVTLDDASSITRSRVAIQHLLRSIVQSHSHLLIVFHYQNPANRAWRFSYAYKEKNVSGMETAKRFTYIFGRDFRSRTAVERFMTLATSKKTDKDFEEAFSVEALSIEFFKRYRDLYADFVQFITGKRYEREANGYVEKVKHAPNVQFETSFDNDDKLVRDYIKKMFGRIVFLYFIQRKGWLANNSHYMTDLFINSDKKDNFLDEVLEPLFFHILNTDKPYRTEVAKSLPDYENIPYLNGGLFEEDDLDRRDCHFPASYFERLFSFFDSYNFTIDENDVEDAEIGIDPEMLGRVFENLLEDNKDKGAYYTPKVIVDYMCRESIIFYLQTGFNQEGKSLIRKFVESMNPELLSDEQKKKLIEKLVRVRICDPAIGSGAFPMGIVNIMSKLFTVLQFGSSFDRTKMKRDIMQNCVYGVDIEKGAVDIARLRFWLAMVVDEQKPQPLPNLQFKVMQGNSLLEEYYGVDLRQLIRAGHNKGEQASLFGSFIDQMANLLANSIEQFYIAKEHKRKAEMLKSISSTVLAQLEKLMPEKSIIEIGKIYENDKFFLWHTWFSDVFRNGGFDIIIGNPPYLKEGRTDQSTFEKVKNSPYYQGKMDLWYMFACMCIDFLKERGLLCFIATNNWVTSGGASILRNKVITDTKIMQFCDFNNYMIFETASIQTMVMLFQKNSIENDYTFDYRKLIKGNTLKDVKDLLEKKETEKTLYLTPTVNRKLFKGKFLTFSPNESLLDKMKGTKSVNYLQVTEISQGIVFPQDFLNKKNQAILGHHQVGDGIFGLTQEEKENLNLLPDENKLVRPYYTSDQITRFYTSPKNKLWLIYTDSSFKNPNSMNQYPNLKRHLDLFLSIMTSDNKPYGLHRARKEKFFVGEKILCQRKCMGRPVFSYSNEECFVTQTYNILKTNRWNNKALVGILNSSAIKFWLANKGKMQGENFQIDNEPLLQIPIVLPPEEEQNQLANLVSQIIDLKASNQEADVPNLERQIDNIVYHLYGFTYDDILAIDPETSITRNVYENIKLK